MPELILELVVVEPMIERHHRGAELRRGEERDHPLRPVRHDDADPVPHPDPELRQRRRHGGGLRLGLSIRQRPPTGDDHRALGMLARARCDRPGERPGVRHQAPVTGPKTPSP